jgi:hypothetical protein
LFEGKTVYVINQRIVRETVPEWASRGWAIAAFALSVITGTLLFALTVKWALRDLKIVPIGDRWADILEKAEGLGDSPEAADYLEVIKDLDAYNGEVLKILFQCKDPEFLIRNLMIRRINTEKTISPIESIFAERHVPSFHSMIAQKVVIN